MAYQFFKAYEISEIWQAQNFWIVQLSNNLQTILLFAHNIL